ncbi:acyltransferase family protein [Yeosuana sp. AK3]
MKNSEVSQKPIKFYGLDNLRAFAIIMVFLFHYARWFEHPEWMPNFFRFGWTGVDLFFVLSGFLISSQLFANIKKTSTFSMKEFYIKRFFRIIPIYFFVLALYFLFPFFSNDFGTGQQLAPLWKFLTFTQNLGVDFANARAFVQVWSLCVEEHFYLILPITLLWLIKTNFFRKGYVLLLLIFIVGFLIRFYCWNNIYLKQTNGTENVFTWIQTIYMPTYNRLDGLLTGVSIAGLYNYLPTLFSKFSKYANAFLFAGLLMIVVAYFLFSNLFTFSGSIFSFPFVAIGFGFLVLGAIMPNSALYTWKSKTLTKIAELSYGLYLIHTAVVLSTQTILIDYGISKKSTLTFIISIILCFLIALVLNYSIERPFMKIRGRFLKNNH